MQTPHPMRTQHGAAKALVLAALLSLAPAGYGALSYVCPCDKTPGGILDRTPGGYLLGPTVSEPVSQWSFANQSPLCQLQIPAAIPYSIDLNCFSNEAGELYLSCSMCGTKRWSQTVLENPDTRIRISGQLYPVRLTRVEDPARLDAIWQARIQKVVNDREKPRPEGWWSFQGVSR